MLHSAKATICAASGMPGNTSRATPTTAAAILEVAPDGVDLVVEVAPAPNRALDLAVTRVHGTIAVYANNGGEDLVLPLRETFSRNLRYQFVILYTLDPALLSLAVTDVSAALADGALRVGQDAGLPLHHYPLEEVGEAQDAVEAGLVGKALLDVVDA